MELIKSKGLVILFTVLLAITILGSYGTKKYDESNKSVSDSYIGANIK